MGTGKKKIEIEKITKETSRMVTFSKRRKGLFKKAKELEFMTGSRVASIVFSPTGRPYTCGDVEYALKRHFSSSRCYVEYALKRHFSSSRCLELSMSGLNSHDSNSDVSDDVVGVVSGESSSSESKSSSTPKRNGLRNWVKGIDVEGCQNLNQLLMLKDQLEGTRNKIVFGENVESFQDLFA